MFATAVTFWSGVNVLTYKTPQSGCVNFTVPRQCSGWVVGVQRQKTQQSARWLLHVTAVRERLFFALGQQAKTFKIHFS